MDISAATWNALSKLLDEALDLSPDVRASWLERMADAQPGLAPSLRKLLAAHTSSETADVLKRLPTLAGGAAADHGGGLSPGDLVGPYRLKRELGSGGMADVWLAERADGAFTREVALKLPRISRLRRDLAARFARERDILARLEHPNIARLYDAGITADGLPYMTMEFVDGQPITQWCDAQRLSVPVRLDLFAQVLDAVQYAHANLVIHRDLKPSNILVTAEGEVRLLDFGIAKLMAGEDAGHETQLTQFAGRALTPDYASPEQIKGEPLTTASDLYSLGVVLYELLCGSRPYRLQLKSAAQLELAIVEAEPPRPSANLSNVAGPARGSSTADLARSLAGDLDGIVLKAMHKAPHRRYATAEAFGRDLQRHLRGEAVSAHRPSPVDRLARLLRRHRTAVASVLLALAAFGVAVGVSATALIIVALSLGFAAAMWQAREAGRARDRALALAARNEAVSDFMNTLLTQAARSGRALTAEQLLERSEQLIEREFKDNPEHRGAVLAMMGMTYHTLGNAARAERLLGKALEVTRESDDTPLRDTLMSQHAIAVAWSGRTDEAAATLQQLIRRPSIAPEQLAEAHSYLAYIAQRKNDAAAALDHSTEALAALRRSRRISPSLEASFLATLGFSLHLNGRNDEADRHYEAAFEKLTQLGRDRGTNAVAILNNWALVNERAGDVRRALSLYDRTLAAIVQDTPDTPAPAYLVANRARALELLGRPDDARAAYDGALVLAEQSGAGLVALYSRLGVASVALELGRIDEAAAEQRKVEAASDIVIPPGSAVAHAHTLLRARLARARDDLTGARLLYSEAIGDGPSIATTVMGLIGRAEVLGALGEFGPAEHDAHNALSMAIALQGGKPHSFRTGLAWLALARALALQQRWPDAHAATTSALRVLSATVDAQHAALAAATELAARTDR